MLQPEESHDYFVDQVNEAWLVLGGYAPSWPLPIGDDADKTRTHPSLNLNIDTVIPLHQFTEGILLSPDKFGDFNFT